MFNGEKKTALMVLIIYLISTVFVLFSISFVYFHFEKDKFQESIKEEMKLDAKLVSDQLIILHNNPAGDLLYPRFKNFESALYDSDKNLIFSTFEETVDFQSEIYRKNGFVYFIYPQNPYYLGTAYVVLQKKSPTFLEAIDKKVLFLPIFILFIIIVTSFFLVKIILKPLKNNIEALDRFIKDTTHELNTPIATIQSNLELLENTIVDEKIAQKLNRIKSATISIKNLYEDLVFLTLNKSLKSSLEVVNINELMKNRLEYFSLLFKSKSLNIILKEKDHFSLFIDEVKITRVIDNLLSNSIKYTHKNKNIEIEIDEKSFSIRDEGIGMSEEEVKNVFERYSRFNDKEMGFGIGYNIIYRVLKEYNLKIKIDSIKGIGTCIKISL